MSVAKRSFETRFGLPLTVRTNVRAKRILVKMVPHQGLVMVLPKGVSPDRADEFLSAKSEWIEQTRQEMEARGIALHPAPAAIPRTIDFRAEGRVWPVLLLNRPGRTTVTENGPRLLVRGELDDPTEALAALRRFTLRRARSVLLPWLTRVGGELGLNHAKMTVRTQKTRWGSCTSRGHVSLNANLMFLPPDLVDQLLVHELCHLRHPNHSAAFWHLVAAHRPDFKDTEQRLQRAHGLVPFWMI